MTALLNHDSATPCSVPQVGPGNARELRFEFGDLARQVFQDPLAQRSLSMIARQLGGVLPKPAALSAADQAMLAAADGMIDKAREAMKTQALHQVLSAIWAVVADANRYFASEAPWALAKTDPARQGTVLYVTAEVIRQVAILAQPFMPASAAKLLDLLAVPPTERHFQELGGARRITAGARLPAPAPVFPRYVDSEASAQA